MLPYVGFGSSILFATQSSTQGFPIPSRRQAPSPMCDPHPLLEVVAFEGPKYPTKRPEPASSPWAAYPRVARTALMWNKDRTRTRKGERHEGESDGGYSNFNSCFLTYLFYPLPRDPD